MTNSIEKLMDEATRTLDALRIRLAKNTLVDDDLYNLQMQLFRLQDEVDVFKNKYTDQELEAMALELWPVRMHKRRGYVSYDINDISRRIGFKAFQHLRDRMIKEVKG